MTDSGNVVGAWLAGAAVFISATQYIRTSLSEKTARRRAQAEQAVKFVEAFYQSKRAALAYHILDFENGTFKLENGDEVEITTERLKTILRITDTEHVGPPDSLVRNAFDEFFARFARLYRLHEVGIVNWTDINALFGYVIGLTRMDHVRAMLLTYIEHYNFMGAIEIVRDTIAFPISLRYTTHRSSKASSTDAASQVPQQAHDEPRVTTLP